MKSIKIISALLILVASIIGFWLVPQINKAKDEKYTRLYEDVSYRAVNDTTRSKRARNISTKELAPPPIVYKTETIKVGLKWKEIDAQKFSRAIQFEPEDTATIPVSTISIVRNYDDVFMPKINAIDSSLLYMAIDTVQHIDIVKKN